MAHDLSAPLRPGACVVPGFRVLGHLSRGSALDVYDVFSEERGCRCVIKMPRPNRAADRKVHRRLFLEGTLLLALTHPHFVRAYELIEQPSLALVLETLTGATLAYLLHSLRGGLPPRDLAALGRQLCSAIGYLHRNGYLHLDLNPSNVISQAGIAKLIDLSIVRRPGPGKRGVGTPRYLAPEQARGGVLGTATDVWGIGALLFEGATGKPPFRDARRTAKPKLPARVRGSLAPSFAEAIEACLEFDPRARPSVQQLASALSGAE
jgi:serine/threonine protein kinase